MYPQLLANLLNVVDLQQRLTGHNAAAVCHLAARFGVQRGVVQDDLNLLALVHLVDLFAAADEADHAGVGSKLLKAGEDGGVIVYPVAVERKVGVAVLLGLVIGLGAAALLAHGVVKAIHVDLKAGFLGHLQGQVDGETVGIVQLKGLLTR